MHFKNNITYSFFKKNMYFKNNITYSFFKKIMYFKNNITYFKIFLCNLKYFYVI